jgi:replicative DNA helicase
MDIDFDRLLSTPLLTGFYELDDLLAGLNPGQLVVVGARPGIGKTSLAVRIAEHVGVVEKRSVFYVALKEQAHDLAVSLACSHVRVAMTDLRAGRLTPADRARFLQGRARIATAPIYFDSSNAGSIQDVCVRCHQQMRRERADLIILDDLQAVHWTRAVVRWEGLAEVSRSLKNLARELRVPILVLSGLARALERRWNRRPCLSDFGEYDAIVGEADAVLLLYRDEVYDPYSPQQGVAELTVAKQRGGPTDRILLAFLAPFARFENLTADLMPA